MREAIEAAREYAEELLDQSGDRFLTLPEVHIVDLVAEVDQLRAELVEARITAQDAWDALDETENAA